MSGDGKKLPGVDPTAGTQPAANVQGSEQPRVPQSTSLFRALNFELFVKPNKVVMTAGLVTLTFCVAYIAYLNATAENRKDEYMALNEQGKLEKRHRTSRWE